MLRWSLGRDKLIWDSFKPSKKIIYDIVYVFCSHGKSNKILKERSQC